ncbi:MULTISPECIES: Tn3 family transposase [unclassified Streptomyces]|uniref:Tn3 family transposase n=1 Tax=unclassified Streptomyces TaxID=2593676 RepID=UPI00336A76DD
MGLGRIRFRGQGAEEGWTIEPEDLAHISPYLTEHINRFGQYSTHELGVQSEAYDPKLDVDFTQLRREDPLPPTSAKPPEPASVPSPLRC